MLNQSGGFTAKETQSKVHLDGKQKALLVQMYFLKYLQHVHLAGTTLAHLCKKLLPFLVNTA